MSTLIDKPITGNVPSFISFARELRKKQTPEEELIWNQLRGKQLLGYKFLRQHPIVINKFNNAIAFYIADFYCAEKKLVVEIDGLENLIDKGFDHARDSILKEMGLQVLRISNEEVNASVYEVLKKIKVLLVK